MPNVIKDGPVRRPDISSLLSLAKYERAHDDDYGQRMIVNGLVLILLAALIATGVLLVINLHD
jgi:hypothetical protein